MERPIAVISGTGQSVVARRSSKSGLALTIDAVRAAVADAGINLSEVDGIATWPGRALDPPSFSPVGVPELKEALRLKLNWYSGIAEGSSQLSSIVDAACAVGAGLARHVVCFRTITEGSGRGGDGDEQPFAVDDRFQWQLPFHAYSAANWLALHAARHFHEFGTTREQLGQIALTARANATINPEAVYRTPLAMDDYLSARMISTPLCLYDCDVPVDASTVVIVSASDAVSAKGPPPIAIAAIGCAQHGRDSYDQVADFFDTAAHDAARAMWSRTRLRPSDVQVAQLYDGFSYLTLNWIEALGFCGRGESGRFVEGGGRIARGGPLPLNTHGGQLSAGRTHGLGYVREACIQLRGEGGARQVAGEPRVAVAAAGGGPLATALLLTRG